MRGLADFRSSMLGAALERDSSKLKANAHICVLILSNGVTANSDSVAPAPKPAMTVAGPEILPSASASMFLYMSKATNPTRPMG
jgi:hypothetical protein